MNLIDAAAWAHEMDVRVTVCNKKGVIVYMNQASALGMHKYGGYELLGKSLFDCHNPASSAKIREMLEIPSVNVYITEKQEERRLIRQFPWEENGEHKGIIEFSFALPFDVEVKNRQ
ncbi:MAG TPA: PAS domain-containing protein [Prolixibacteraceae bacterium]|nr:PAS sensor protein [Bacteroidales bacterium]HPB05166.1 PAS domain-containing protein [Prolixibacteraceae bacterium]HQN92639.1 PAS domain-containing protein [Prolixibacteraceae bacterium]